MGTLSRDKLRRTRQVATGNRFGTGLDLHQHSVHILVCVFLHVIEALFDNHGVNEESGHASRDFGSASYGYHHGCSSWAVGGRPNYNDRRLG